MEGAIHCAFFLVGYSLATHAPRQGCIFRADSASSIGIHESDEDDCEGDYMYDIL